MKPLLSRILRDNRTPNEKAALNLIYFVKRWGKTNLDLSNLSLESLPTKIFELDLVRNINLSNNCLKSLPVNFNQLSSLETVNLSKNSFTNFPHKKCLPVNLKKISLRGNNIEKVEINKNNESCSLIYINLRNNKIINFNYSSSTENNLKIINLSKNKLSDIFIETNIILSKIYLSQNQLDNTSINISNTIRLKYIFLKQNNLTEIPDIVLKSPCLETLDLSSNKLTSINPDIVEKQLFLKQLLLNDNKITELPMNFDQLYQLKELQVSKNKIKILHPRISRLPNIEIFEALDNPIESPPKAVIEQGSLATLRFLKEIDIQASSANPHRLWTSKLMLVGEGGVGKTSLLKSIKGESHNISETTTHGIHLDAIKIKHPREKAVEMNLNIWDFGGQQIYHATHQFFLTDNSIFILVWNARTEFNQARPYYWLDMITANAPNAPIILVATHLDQRRELIPLDYLKEKYPKITAFFEISNVNRQGVDKLYSHIRTLAADLPLMGKSWPQKWDDAVKKLKEISKKIITRKELFNIFKNQLLDNDESEILSRYLHELGEILQYPESPALKNLVILKPQWISEYISKIITSNSVLDSGGILNQETISNHWNDLEKPMQELFLELMEQYDLAYKIPGDHINRAIIVEQLHPDRPSEYQEWRQLLKRQDLKKVEIEYRLSSMQPGLPTWFIARTHRFSLGIHWKRGAIFADGKQRRNRALIEAFDQEKIIRLTIIGTSPHNFLSILKDGLELTFARYPGMKVISFVPCPDENIGGESCQGHFPYQNLEKALDQGRSSLQCQYCFNDVKIQQLLFGIGRNNEVLINNLEEEVCNISKRFPDTNSIALDKEYQFDSQVFLIHQINRIIYQQFSELKNSQNAQFIEIRQMLEGVSDNFELLHRRFNAQFKALQSNHESHCPSTFIFKAGDRSENIVSNSPVELHLLCQFPKQIHPATQPIGNSREYSSYLIQQPKKWIVKLAPYISAVSQLISHAPIVPNSPLAETADLIDKCIEHMEFVLDRIDSFAEESSLVNISEYDRNSEIIIDGAQLRAFRTLLDRLDPSQEWQGLKKWLSPEGHYLWLCPYHFNQCGKHFEEYK